MAKKNYNFIKPTLKFCIAGIFIPGFTAILILGLQMTIEFLGVECSKTWIILWTMTAIGIIVAPIIFLKLMDRELRKGFHLGTDKLLIFNLVEYTFIQCFLASLFTNGQTLCYVSDGQNGLEFVFTAWMALPILVIFSLKFDNIRDSKVHELKAAGIID